MSSIRQFLSEESSKKSQGFILQKIVEKKPYFTARLSGDIATDNHTLYEHTQEYWNLAHSAHMALVVLKFQHWLHPKSKESAIYM